MSEVLEKKVLDRLSSDGEQVVAELFTKHDNQFRRLLEFRMDRRLYGRVDSSDILQEAYLDAVNRIDHYLGDLTVSVFVWLRGIVNQTLINVHRRHLGVQARDAGREENLRKGGPHTTSDSLAAHLVGHLTSPSQAAIKAEMTMRLEEALDGMDQIDREVLILRHFEELTNNEVAEVLGLQKAAASNRYVRALARLKKILESIPGFLSGE
ncbi:MAG: RNA polymerase subunit sigma [Planctomycetaceae bacterium]|nr:RNA polymerase subunit sigma [Planctomycetaceae bacterium]